MITVGNYDIKGGFWCRPNRELSPVGIESRRELQCRPRGYYQV